MCDGMGFQGLSKSLYVAVIIVQFKELLLVTLTYVPFLNFQDTITYFAEGSVLKDIGEVDCGPVEVGRTHTSEIANDKKNTNLKTTSSRNKFLCNGNTF